MYPPLNGPEFRLSIGLAWFFHQIISKTLKIHRSVIDFKRLAFESVSFLLCLTKHNLTGKFPVLVLQ